jgi:hypothetical protein
MLCLREQINRRMPPVHRAAVAAIAAAPTTATTTPTAAVRRGCKVHQQASIFDLLSQGHKASFHVVAVFGRNLKEQYAIICPPFLVR